MASVKRLRMESNLSKAKRVVPAYKRMIMHKKNASETTGVNKITTEKLASTKDVV